MYSMYGGAEGGRNPHPQYQGQCIMGENGYPLIAARIHYRNGGTNVQWRRAEVECGLAMDGGLQDVVLHAAFQSTQNVIYVDQAILDQKEHMDAIQTALKGAIPNRTFTFQAIKEGVAPPDGAIVIHLATKDNSSKDLFVPGQPTKTNLFWQLQSAASVQNQGYTWPSLGSRGIESRSRSRYW